MLDKYDLVPALRSSDSGEQTDDGENFNKIHIGAERYLSVTRFKNELRVHIRRHEKTASGRDYPTKMGVCLPVKRFARFLDVLSEVTDRIAAATLDSQILEYRRHIGGGIFVTMDPNFKVVNLRLYFRPEGTTKPIPTRCGVTIKLDNWRNLVQAVEKVSSCYHELRDASPCYMDDDHMNQMVMHDCNECTPFKEIL